MKRAAQLSLAVLALLLAPPAAGLAHAAAGTPVDDVELQTVGGGTAHLLLAGARANLVVFFRTGQERSADALVQLAKCEKLFEGKRVHWAGVVSSTEEAGAVRALVAKTGIAMPVLVDQDDALYGRLGIRLHPMVAFIDGDLKVAAVEMYRQIDYCEIIIGRIQLMLGEIDQATFQLVLEPPRSTMPGDDPRDVGRRDVNLGRALLKRKAYELALQSARKALERAPLAAAFSLMGDVHAARGDCAAARKQYQQALKLDARDPAALKGLTACPGK
jgi:tetratricopeptide (TPR) repeat protein